MLELAIAAIFTVESANQPNPPPGDNGKSHGIGQIQQPVLDDVNLRYGTHYTIRDCYNPRKARNIARKYLTMWCGEDASLQNYVRTWNGGPRWRTKPGRVKARTFAYWKKCQNEIPQITGVKKCNPSRS